MQYSLQLRTLSRGLRSLSSSSISNPRHASSRATFANGCFWGTENYFSQKMDKVYPNEIVNIVEGAVGFMGPVGEKPNPTYKQVCQGSTKYVEAFDFKFLIDEKNGGEADERRAYEKLCKFFFMMHDPTTFNSQGNDRGPQYASKIYCHSDTQYDIATHVLKELQDAMDKGFQAGYKLPRIVTAIEKAPEKFLFFPADEDHQQYLQKNPSGYCNHFIRFPVWPS